MYFNADGFVEDRHCFVSEIRVLFIEEEKKELPVFTFSSDRSDSYVFGGRTTFVESFSRVHKCKDNH